jgi:hypothetical protein
MTATQLPIRQAIILNEQANECSKIRSQVERINAVMPPNPGTMAEIPKHRLLT